jgi:hypothetical protein
MGDWRIWSGDTDHLINGVNIEKYLLTIAFHEGPYKWVIWF